MNKGLLGLNIFLLFGLGVLYYLFFTEKKGVNPVNTSSRNELSVSTQELPVAYFEMDSIESHFALFKSMQEEVIKKEQVKNDSINLLRIYFQNYVQNAQPLFQKMSPPERDSLNSVVMDLDNQIKGKITELNQRYQAYYFGKQQEVIGQIKSYCKEFNKDRKYSYIIANEPGLFYYSDTAYNITSELLKGLNEYYSKKKN